jgi:type IV secretory pathway VirJ component
MFNYSSPVSGLPVVVSVSDGEYVVSDTLFVDVSGDSGFADPDLV